MLPRLRRHAITLPFVHRACCLRHVAAYFYATIRYALPLLRFDDACLLRHIRLLPPFLPLPQLRRHHYHYSLRFDIMPRRLFRLRFAIFRYAEPALRCRRFSDAPAATVMPDIISFR